MGRVEESKESKSEKDIVLPSRNSQASETESDAKSFQSTCFSNFECAESVWWFV